MEERTNTRTGMRSFLNGIDPALARVLIPWLLRHPRYIRAFPRMSRAIKRTSSLRARAREDGLMVPPFMILSITSRCNLRCAGCFAAATGTTHYGGQGGKGTLEWEQWRAIIEEARDLGVFGFVIAGGEPFLFPDLLGLCQEFEDSVFIILTNGTAMTEEDHGRLARSTNVAVVVSIEGGEEMTDSRRGRGVYERAVATLDRLKRTGVPLGVSVTVTNRNLHYWMEEGNMDPWLRKGIRLGIFLEYIPIGNTEEEMEKMLGPEEREALRVRILEYRSKKPIYLIHSPGDEDLFGGCVSAGRGFAHVTPSGDLTPCPVSDLATHNLTRSTLSEGLAADLFEKIRENEHLLENGNTPCALFAHPQEVSELAVEVGAYRSNSTRG